MVSTSRGDTGTITVDLPPGAEQTVRLRTMSATSGAAIAISLPPGQTRSLTLIVPAPDLAGDQAQASANPSGWTGGAASGPITGGETASSPAGWSALGGLLLATLALVAAGLRRATLRR